MRLMRAVVLPRVRSDLELLERELPDPTAGQVLVRVRACGVCRTDLHLVDGELPNPKLPVIPGHEVIGIVEKVGPGVTLQQGQRVGVPWLGWTCGECEFCRRGQENLCGRARFTGYTLDGGYAEALVCDARYCFPLRSSLSDAHAAPLMCAGLIGYRSLSMAGDAERLGIYGFGAAAHIIAQIAIQQGRQIYAFVKPGDERKRRFAEALGASWVGTSEQRPPTELDASLIFAPVGDLVVAALRSTARGGTVVCGGIHMSDIPSFPYSDLWGERCIRSVANLTRNDGQEFMTLLERYPVETSVVEYPLQEANVALSDLRHGKFEGAAVLMP